MVKRSASLPAATLIAAALHAPAAWADDACACRYDGQRYEYGSVVCLNTPAGQRLARCEMVQNVTFWRFLETACPQANLDDESVLPVSIAVRYDGRGYA